MPNTRTLQSFLDNLISSRHAQLLEMLTEDAIMEFPYHLPTTPAQLTGKPEIVAFFDRFQHFLTLDTVQATAIHQTTKPNIAIIECEGAGHFVQTGRTYTQHYVEVLTLRDGKIAHWKDYWNPMNVISPQEDTSKLL